MLVELGYQLYIHACSGNYLENIFLLFFLSFSDFLLKLQDGGSRCPDGKVDSSGRPFSLSRRVCFCDLLRGTTSKCHLSSVWTMNPVGLYRIPPMPQLPHIIFFGFFCRFVLFLCFLCIFLTFTCHLCNLSPTQVCFYTLLLIYFKFLCLK
jgi:hypothetical protein